MATHLTFREHWLMRRVVRAIGAQSMGTSFWGLASVTVLWPQTSERVTLGIGEGS